MGNGASTTEDFSKTIDFCKQLRLLHFVWNEPSPYSAFLLSHPSFRLEHGYLHEPLHDPSSPSAASTNSSSSSSATSSAPSATSTAVLRSQHDELARRIAEIDFGEYRLMFAIRRVLFSVPFRVSLIGYDLLHDQPDDSGRRVKYIISFDTREHRPSPGAEGDVAQGGVRSYRTKRSYNEFMKLDDRIRNLFDSAEERKEKEQFETELDRRERFMRKMEKPGESAKGKEREEHLETTVAPMERRASLEEVQFEQDCWIYIKPKSSKRDNSKDVKSKQEDPCMRNEGEQEDDGKKEEDGYAALHLPPLPPRQFCWDDAAKLALAETRLPLLDAYLKAIMANPFLANHEVLLQFLFSPDSFGDEVDEEDESEKAGGAEAVTTPKMRQKSDFDVSVSAAIVNDYEAEPSRTIIPSVQSEQKDSPKPRVKSPPGKLSGELVIIDNWEPEDNGENTKRKADTLPLTSLVGSPEPSPDSIPAALQQSVQELFGSSPFFSMIDELKEPAEQGDSTKSSKEGTGDNVQQSRELQDDWSFLSIEMAVCRRRSRRKENESEDNETLRLMERTRTIERLMDREARNRQAASEEAEHDEEEEEEEEQERHRRVMSRLQEAEEWVNELDGGARRKRRRKWRVTNLESYILSTGTGELHSVLCKCLEKQAKALMVAKGLEGGKTGAIIASKKGAATLLQKSLAILGVTTSREVNLMMAACLQLALSRVLLFLRLNSLEAFLASRFFIHSSTYIGEVAALSALSSAKLIAKANILGVLVAFLVEEIYLFILFLRVWKFNGERGLNLHQFIKETLVNVASNSSAYAGAIAGGTIGTMIEPGGGTIIGSLIGGILCGLLVSFGSSYVYAKIYGDDDDDEAGEVELEEMNRLPTAEEEEEAEEEQWEKLHLNADLWEELVAEFEQLDGTEYEYDTVDEIRHRNGGGEEGDHTEAMKETNKKGSSRRRRRSKRSSSSSAPSSSSTSMWNRVMSVARRRRVKKINARKGTRSHEESEQSPH